MVLITKGGFPWLNPDFTFRRLRITREAILGDFYTSIDNLNGPVDLYLLHRDDESKPVSYIMDILNEIVKSYFIHTSCCSIARTNCSSPS